MRAEALTLARLDDRDLQTVDVGAGTGFATEGIVAHVDARNVTLLDQSPHQLVARAAQAGAARVPHRPGRRRGAARSTPTASTATSRAARSSTGRTRRPRSPRPTACSSPAASMLMVGPLPPERRSPSALADLWMLFPQEHEYRDWMEQRRLRRHPHALRRAGLVRSSSTASPSPGRKPARGRVAGRRLAPRESVDEPMTARRWARWVAGSAAGAVFVPVGHRRQPARALARAAPSPTVTAALWRFARPHTIVGTTLSVLGIYAIAAHGSTSPPAYDIVLHAARRAGGERLHRRHQPAHRRRDRPHQQAAAAARVAAS